jgi:hypothetical protein
MFSWLPAMADGAKGGQAAPADITSPRPEESWIDELTVSQLTDNPTGGGEVEHSARSMEQQRSLKEWLEGIKPGYASRFAVAFEAAGVEDSDDLEHMDLGIYREVEAALFKRAIGYDVVDVTVSRKGEPVETKKHVPADVTAQIFFLKNRVPDRWTDVRHNQVSGSLNTGGADLSRLSKAELEQLDALYEKAEAGADGPKPTSS